MNQKKNQTNLEVVIVSAVALLLGLAFVLFLSISQSYEVWMTWPDRHVVAVYDNFGRKLDPSKVDLKSVRYDVVWVAEDYQGGR